MKNMGQSVLFSIKISCDYFLFIFYIACKPCLALRPLLSVPQIYMILFEASPKNPYLKYIQFSKVSIF